MNKINKLIFSFPSKILNKSYILALIIVPITIFFPIPSVIFTLIFVGLLFQGLYLQRLMSTNKPYMVIEILAILSFIYAMLFFKELYNLTNLIFLSYVIPVSLCIFRLRREIRIKVSYLENSKVAFLLLLSAFILVWFASGFLDLVTTIFSLFNQFGSSFILLDALSAFASVTASSWFMISMGIWLGIVGIFRVIEYNKLENKIRYLLMMFAYAFYSIYLPSFSPISNEVQYIPYMWFNGLGTYGPVEPSYLFDGIIGTFVVTAVLSFIFGSRQICSVTCTAPYMLQGTFLDSMKKYNRSSKIGRKTLTSRLSSWYKWVMILTWSSLLVFAVLSYLDYEGIITFSILGNDPTVFYASLYFNVIWYIQFMLMPFLGNYACVNNGICAWGSFNQLFGYLGFFKLKIKDPKQCLNCKTVDCANACPVGLTDMRASFIKKGEFKSFKCIGVGDCVEACPYNNIMFYDFRSWIRSKLNKKGIIKDSVELH